MSARDSSVVSCWRILPDSGLWGSIDDACVPPHRHLWPSDACTQLSTIGQRAFPDAGARVWNGLPRDVISAPSLGHLPRSPLSPSIAHSLFHSRLKKHVFHKSFHQSASTHLDCLLGLYWTGLTLLNGFSFLVIFLSFYFGSCGRQSWLNCQLSSAR